MRGCQGYNPRTPAELSAAHAQPAQEGAVTRSDILDLIARRDAALNHRDVPAMTALHAEDGVVESLVAGTVQGHSPIAEVYDAWFTAFPDVTVRTDEVLVDGDRAVQFATVTGTDMGSFMGMPATGRPFRMPIVFLYTFRDGLIGHERRIYDFTGLLVQIGVLKAKPV